MVNKKESNEINEVNHKEMNNVVDIEVGPTDCNKDRDKRDAWISILITNFSTRVDEKTEGAMHASIIFFREAIGCYQNRNFVACTSMCGAAMESILIDLLLYNHKKAIKDVSGSSFAWSHVQEFTDNKFRDYFREFVSSDKNRPKKRKEMIQKLCCDKILDKTTSKKITRILDQRDQVMHYTENTWRRFFEDVDKSQIDAIFFWPFNENKTKDILESSLDVLSYASAKFLKIIDKASTI